MLASFRSCRYLSSDCMTYPPLFLAFALAFAGCASHEYWSDRQVSTDGKTCTKHQCKMVLQSVPVAYGLSSPTAETFFIDREFPNANFSSDGGCEPRTGLKTQRILVCPECRLGLENYNKQPPFIRWLRR